jgi:glucokinase
MADAAAEGDDTIADAIRVAADYLGLGIANAVTITAVPNVNIGGGLSILRDLLVEPVRQQIRRRVRMFPADVVQVSCSSLGEKCGGLGGVALAVQGYSRTTLSVST